MEQIRQKKIDKIEKIYKLLGNNIVNKPIKNDLTPKYCLRTYNKKLKQIKINEKS